MFLSFSANLVQVGIAPLLPRLGADFEVSTATSVWLVTASPLSGTIFLTFVSRVADLVGKRPVMVGSLGVVLVGSVLGSVATSFCALLVARILMGASWALLALRRRSPPTPWSGCGTLL